MKDSVIGSEVLPVTFSDHSALIVRININPSVKTGKPFWKLNIRLLKDENIRERFIRLWDFLKSKICRYRSINVWWNDYVKTEVKNFFIREGIKKSKETYGLINYLEGRLREQYKVLNVNGTLDYRKHQQLKERINNLKLEILEGVKVRARMQDLECGERVSVYVIQKQKELSAKKLMTCLYSEDGCELKGFDAIHAYVTSYYSDLYKARAGCAIKQNKFLDLLECKLDDGDRELLCEEVTKQEIYQIVKSTTNNRTPGIDGIPIEFYLEFWNIIGNEFVCIVKNGLKEISLKSLQKKSIVTLIKKDGNEKDLNNWRPISLLCVDYKIIAKLIAKRMQRVLDKIIDSGQFCGVPGRSIVQCNMLLRDIMFYVNNENREAAIVKLYWHKAFDLVNVEFLFKVLNKLGFGDFVSWINILYDNPESAMYINNVIGKFFTVTRSVRQGCPLSMILYVIYQEPFFMALRKNPSVEPLVLPNYTEITSVGYADDNNVVIISDSSMMEVERTVLEFESATMSQVNRNDKSKVYGMGKWQNKRYWPRKWLKQDCKSFYTLGLHHINDYRLTLQTNWENAISKIETHTRAIAGRKLTLFQRASYVNACILSKIWYISHIYPLGYRYGQMIEKLIFSYLWGGKYQPIKEVLYIEQRLKVV